MALIEGVDSITLIVSDMDRSIGFYENTLTFSKDMDEMMNNLEFDRLYGLEISGVRIVKMSLGDESIILMQPNNVIGNRIDATPLSCDPWFQHAAIVVSDMDEAYDILRKNEVSQISSAPQTLPDWNEEAAGIKAFYFTDPDGHPLELIEYPAGKGEEKWQELAKREEESPRLFLGIDHTAIVVSDINSSLAFYKDILGMDILGESENYGVEQEQLSNVPGARVRIIEVSGNEGIGLEFLEYTSHKGMKGNILSNEDIHDIRHSHTNFETKNIDELYKIFIERGISIISPHVVRVRTDIIWHRKCLMVRGPNGHNCFFFER